MRFADPYFLVLLALIPILAYLKSRFVNESGGGRFSSLGILAGYQPTWRLRFRWLPTLVRALALGLLVLALARPQAGQAESEVAGEGIDITIVLDTSTSMTSFTLGTDTAMTVAKRVLDEFIAGRQDDQIGLVIFRDSSVVLSPLTLDYAALRSLVDRVEDVSLTDGTAIGVGLAHGLNLLRDSRAQSRVAILLTDGQNNSGQIEPLAAARIAEALGIRVYTIGLIDPRSRASGSLNVDEHALREMAQLTDGNYFPAESEEALSSIYASIDQLEKSRVGRPQFTAYNELASYFLVAALTLLALELGLRATVWRQSA
jgi:Ca-activated chloride channel family protein